MKTQTTCCLITSIIYILRSRISIGGADKLVAIAKALRPDGLTLWTFQCNVRARRFYEARGFVASGFTDGSRNEENEPDVLYMTATCLRQQHPNVNVRFVVGIEA
jgi:hypothetical protein